MHLVVARLLSKSSDVSPWPWPWSLRPKSKSLALALWLKSLGLGLGLGIQVLGRGLGLESSPWPWPWPWPWPRPRLRRSRPRCYHALHLRPGLCGMEFVPLRYLFERIVAVPASSALWPVERVFSNSGLIICLNRAKMSDKLLKSLCLPSVPSSANCWDG